MRIVEIPPGSDQKTYEEAIRTELTKVYGYGQFLHIRNGHPPLGIDILLNGQRIIKESSARLTALIEQLCNDRHPTSNSPHSLP